MRIDTDRDMRIDTDRDMRIDTDTWTSQEPFLQILRKRLVIWAEETDQGQDGVNTVTEILIAQN
jgi:hypothetical protein